MNIISREELKAKLDRGDDFKLVMAMGEWAYKMAHIPGSLNISSMVQAEGLISLDDEIVVYCADERCTASQAAYHFLVSHGYTNVRRYSGGLSEWQAAGYPLEGDDEFSRAA